MDGDGRTWIDLGFAVLAWIQSFGPLGLGLFLFWTGVVFVALRCASRGTWPRPRATTFEEVDRRVAALDKRKGGGPSP